MKNKSNLRWPFTCILADVENEFEDEEPMYGEPGLKKDFYAVQNDAEALIEAMTPAKGSTIKIITSYGDWGWEQTEPQGSLNYPNKWIKWLVEKVTSDHIKLKVVAYLRKGDSISVKVLKSLQFLRANGIAKDGDVEFRKTDTPQIAHYVLCSDPRQLWIEEDHKDGKAALRCRFVEFPYPETFDDVDGKFNKLFAASTPLNIEECCKGLASGSVG